MNRTELMELLPHRNSMLLLDEAEVIDGAAHGKKKITGEEWFLDGHFPGHPVMPGVLIIEALAQVGAVALLTEKENKGKLNATKKRTGKSTEELTHSKNPVTRKRAIFAQNAKRWSKK